MTGFISVAMVLAGVIAPLVGIVLRSRARRQVGWEAVHGTICAANVRFDGEYYVPQLEYTYSYGGRVLRGTKLKSLAVLVNWASPAERTIRKYPLGSAVTVFVNPESPAEAVLEPGGDPKFLPLILIVSAFLLAMGLALFYAPGKR